LNGHGLRRRRSHSVGLLTFRRWVLELPLIVQLGPTGPLALRWLIYNRNLAISVIFLPFGGIGV